MVTEGLHKVTQNRSFNRWKKASTGIPGTSDLSFKRANSPSLISNLTR